MQTPNQPTTQPPTPQYTKESPYSFLFYPYAPGIFTNIKIWVESIQFNYPHEEMPSTLYVLKHCLFNPDTNGWHKPQSSQPYQQITIEPNTATGFIFAFATHPTKPNTAIDITPTYTITPFIPFSTYSESNPSRPDNPPQSNSSPNQNNKPLSRGRPGRPVKALDDLAESTRLEYARQEKRSNKPKVPQLDHDTVGFVAMHKLYFRDFKTVIENRLKNATIFIDNPNFSTERPVGGFNQPLIQAPNPNPLPKPTEQSQQEAVLYGRNHLPELISKCRKQITDRLAELASPLFQDRLTTTINLEKLHNPNTNNHSFHPQWLQENMRSLQDHLMWLQEQHLELVQYLDNLEAKSY